MKSLLLAACCAALAPFASAQIPVFQQPMAANGGTLRNSQLWIDPTGQNDLDSDAIAWEDFQFAQDTVVTRLRWWGETAPPLGFEISFYHQDPNTIAIQPDMFAAGSGPITQFVTTSAVSTSAGGAMYRFDLTLPTPFACTANTRYFVSVVGRTPVAYATWNWAASSVASTGTFWWSRGLHMYFHLGENRALALATAAGWPVGDVFCAGDGSATACPCGTGGLAARGCPNSIQPGGAWLAGTGVASVSADTLTLSCAGIPNGPGLYFQGDTALNGSSGFAFGDGLRCAGGTVTRLGIVTTSSNASTYPSGTTPPNNVPVSVRGAVAAGTRHYQLWYRDSDPSFCTTSTFNTTNGLTVTWQP